MQTFVLTVRKAMPDLETLSEKRCEYCPDGYMAWPGKYQYWGYFCEKQEVDTCSQRGPLVFLQTNRQARTTIIWGTLFLSHTPRKEKKRKDKGTVLQKKRTSSLPI